MRGRGRNTPPLCGIRALPPVCTCRLLVLGGSVLVMSLTVKKLQVIYNPVNERNTFTNGDVVCGHVTVEVSKDCQLDSLCVKFKGKAEVLWTERHGQNTSTYHSKDKYFSVRQYFIRDKNIKGALDFHLRL